MKKLLSKIHTLQDTPWVEQAGLICFYIALVAEALLVIVDKSAFINPFEGRIFQVTFALCVVKVLFTKYEWREYLAIFICCVIGLLTDQIGGRNEILRIFMFVAACHGTDLKKNLKIVFKITLIGTVLIVLLSLFGVLGTITVQKEYAGEVFKTHYCFGMGNANAFHCMVFVLCLLAMYLYREKFRWWMYLLILAGDIGLFFLTNSKTATGMIAVAVVGMWVIRLCETKRRKIASAFSILCIALNVGSVGLSVYFAAQAWRVHDWDWDIYRDSSSEFIVWMNKILTGRIRGLTENDPWAGTIDSWRLFADSSADKYFDLGFVRLFYWYGIIPAALIIVLFGILLVYLYRRRRFAEIVFLTICSLYTVVEAHFVSVYIGRCYPLIILGVFWGEMMHRNNWKTSRLSDGENHEI